MQHEPIIRFYKRALAKNKMNCRCDQDGTAGVAATSIWQKNQYLWGGQWRGGMRNSYHVSQLCWDTWNIVDINAVVLFVTERKIVAYTKQGMVGVYSNYFISHICSCYRGYIVREHTNVFTITLFNKEKLYLNQSAVHLHKFDFGKRAHSYAKKRW